MIRTATIDGEQANRRHLTLANGTGYWRSDLLISAETDSPAPQAFLIAAFHPFAADTFATAPQLVSFIRRTPDPTLQFVRASLLAGLGPRVSGGGPRTPPVPSARIP